MKVPPPSDLRVSHFSGSQMSVGWEAAAADVESYLIKWISLSGGVLRQVRLHSHRFTRNQERLRMLTLLILCPADAGRRQ